MMSGVCHVSDAREPRPQHNVYSFFDKQRKTDHLWTHQDQIISS